MHFAHCASDKEIKMNDDSTAGSYELGGSAVRRVGYGAMRLAGPGVFGPPQDRGQALAVLREAVALGVDHIDTSDFYGPHVVNQLIREALSPYPDGLTIVTKVGALRGDDGSWRPAFGRDELVGAVHDNLRNLGLDALDVVNLRMGVRGAPGEGPFEEALAVLIDLKRNGLIRGIGLSHVTAAQVRRGMEQTEIACVQNEYNLVRRGDDALVDELTERGVPFVPYFPLGGFTPLQASALSDAAAQVEATPMQVALAWLLRRSPNILLIPGTSSVGHLRENLAAGEIALPDDVMRSLDGMAGTDAGPAH